MTRRAGLWLSDHSRDHRDRLAPWIFQAKAAAIRVHFRHGFAEIERTGRAGNDLALPDIRLLWERIV